MAKLRLQSVPPFEAPSCFSADWILDAAHAIDQPIEVLEDESGRMGAARVGEAPPHLARIGMLPPIRPDRLGDRSFREAHGTRYAYVAGEMATGIATTDLVIAMARAGMLGFFGSAGLPLAEVERAIGVLETQLGGLSWGMNLIHSPQEPRTEEAVTEMFLRRGVRRVCASAFMGLSPNVVHYAASGLTEDALGHVVRKNHLFAKLSRPEVARHFLAPAPAAVLDALVAAGKLTTEEARLAARVAVAEDITVEADSGGHTDNRPLPALFPVILRLRDEAVQRHGYTRPLRVGAAGGLGTPAGVASAFALGAAYVVTGSINQGAVEGGTSSVAKELLAQAGIADVCMAPAADMFELGVKVQVLKRGTMFAVRGAKLYEIYNSCASLDAIPAATKAQIEKDLFRAPLEQIWEETRAYWSRRDAREVERAEREPKHKMALVFRWYLGNGSRWARTGDATRRLDYQIWCGPAMGAFNAWVAGSFLEKAENRTAVAIARNLLAGAAALTRAQQLRTLGVDVPDAAFQFQPRPIAD